MTSAATRPQATAVNRTQAPEILKRPARAVLRGYARLTARRRPMPDFLVIGTKRGGTTSMWHDLLAHPAVLPMYPTPRMKSPHFFDMNWTKGPAWYRSHFASVSVRARLARRLGASPVAGESSPYYLFHPLVPGRVAATLPDVKLVVLLRDPVQRAYSHWKERTNEGVETLPFEAALAAEEERTAGEVDRISSDPGYYGLAHDSFHYRQRGEYVDQLARWLEFFPREQMLILVSEEFYEDPAREIRKVTDFLGIPPHDLERYKHHNYTPSPAIPGPAAADLAEHYGPYNSRLAVLLGRKLPWSS